MENQQNVNSGQGNLDNRESLNDSQAFEKDTQNFNNYDSHSEEKPFQTGNVTSNDQQDRSSGLNSDSSMGNSNDNLETYPTSSDDSYDELDEDLEDEEDDFDDDEELEDDDEMGTDRQNRAYDSETETGNTNTEFPRRGDSEFSSNL